MHGCQGCRDNLLDYLYDLLDEAEAAHLRAHLEGCPACQAALGQARAQQKLLAAAARLHFPGVTFAPPPEPAPVPAVTAQPAPSGVRNVLLPVKPRLRRPVRWQPWAAAAAVLLAVAGLGSALGLAGRDYAVAGRVAQEKEDALADARDAVKSANEELRIAAHERDQRIEEVRHNVRARELRVEVQGPQTIQAGAPADFLVRTLDLNGNPAAADVYATLDLPGRKSTAPRMTKGGEGKEKDQRDDSEQDKKPSEATKKLDKGDADVPTVRELAPGIYHVSIPASLDLRPNQSVAMSVVARRKGLDDRRLALQGTLRLNAPVYLTHLTTDKPMYQPGEVVRFRSLTVDRSSLRPAGEDFRLVYSLVAPDGSVKATLRGANALSRADNPSQPTLGPDGKKLDGVGAGEFALGDAPGGEWTLTLSEESGRFAPTSRRFTVNRYQKPELDKKLDFNKPTYGSGDQVRAVARATRAGGGPVKDKPVEITVNVDGNLIGPDGGVSGKPFSGRTDADGSVVAAFRLPQTIERGSASLTVTFHDGASEAITRTIPIVLNKLDVEFFPEGGDLIAGLSNRVYFSARTPLGKPAQVSATLLEDGKPLPGGITTLSDDEQPGINQGNGSFSFTPRPKRKYALRIDSPAGIDKTFDLPQTLEDGVVLSSPGVFEANECVRVNVTSTRPRTLFVGVYCRGRLLDAVRLDRGQTEAVLKPSSGVGGVCRVTVFEEQPGRGEQRDLRPLAERLVYRHPHERLDLALTADKRSYVPGQRVNLSVLAVNEREKLTPAVVMLAVVDKSVVTMADQKTDRSMPAHLLLTTEVRQPDDLEYADFLVGQHPKAAAALDLLLGTQGWRRFAEQSPQHFRERLVKETRNLPAPQKQQREEEAERLLLLIGQSTPKKTDFDQEEIDRVKEDFEAREEHLKQKAGEAEATLTEAGDDAAYRSALAKLAWYEGAVARSREVALPLLTVTLVVLLVVGVVRLARRRGAATCFAAAACGLLLVLAWLMPARVTPHPAQDDRQVALNEAAPAKHDRPWDAEEVDGKAEKDDQAADRGGPGAGRAGQPPAIPAPSPPGGVLHPKVAPQMLEMHEAVGKGEAKKAEQGLADKPAPMAKGGAGGKSKVGGFFKGKGAADKGKNMKLGQKDVAKGDAAADEKKDRFGEGKGGFGGGGKRDAKEGLPVTLPFVVREYAHQRQGGDVRHDFAETVYWHPALVMPDGKFDVSFELCDSVTTFEAVAFAHTLDGRLGAVTKRIDSRLPFTLAPKLPIELTATDRLDLPLTVANNTADEQKVELRLDGHDGLTLLEGQRDRKLRLKGEARGRETFSFRPSLVEGKAAVRFSGKCGPFSDSVEHSLKVVPDGFPFEGSSSDLLEKSASHRVKLPATWIDGTLKVRVDVYPSTLADLQKGLDGLLREPHGCFEQSSTANYPNVLILDYLKTADKLDPQLERKVRELLDRGYRKLTSFECQEPGKGGRRGYEWFGGTAPPHEALTAYGLLQFTDMAKNSDVDAAMLKRTREYLLSQRDGNGGYRRNPRALDTFGRAPEDVTNAYVTWALSEADADVDLTKEIESLAQKAKKSDDPYFLSLVALSLANRGQREAAETVLKAVAKKQKAEGHLDAAATSITGSAGRSLQIETTALAVLAWLKTNPVTFDANVRSAVKWIGQQRGGHGAFGSTQSTILALKALIAHAKANKRTPQAGELMLFVGEKEVARLSFPAGVDRPLTLELPNPQEHLKAGENKLRVEVSGEKNVFPHTLSWTYRTTKPDSAAKAPLTLSTSLAKSDLAEGESARLTVRVKNVTGAGQGMAVAIVGLPAGLSLPEDLKQLKEYTRSANGGKPLLSAFEVLGREVVLYWRDLAPDQEIVVPIDLVARVPGEYRGPASRAYLYYDADVKQWVEPLAVKITAR